MKTPQPSKTNQQKKIDSKKYDLQAEFDHLRVTKGMFISYFSKLTLRKLTLKQVNAHFKKDWADLPTDIQLAYQGFFILCFNSVKLEDYIAVGKEKVVTITGVEPKIKFEYGDKLTVSNMKYSGGYGFEENSAADNKEIEKEQEVKAQMLKFARINNLNTSDE